MNKVQDRCGNIVTMLVHILGAAREVEDLGCKDKTEQHDTTKPHKPKIGLVKTNNIVTKWPFSVR